MADALWGHYFRDALKEHGDRHALVERFADDHAVFGHKKPELRRFARAILHRHCPPNTKEAQNQKAGR